MNSICCCSCQSAFIFVFQEAVYKREHFISMSISGMSPQMLLRTILVFTLVTGIVQSIEKRRANTYWSKRSGEDKPITIQEQELSKEMEEDKSQHSFPWEKLKTFS